MACGGLPPLAARWLPLAARCSLNHPPTASLPLPLCSPPAAMVQHGGGSASIMPALVRRLRSGTPAQRDEAARGIFAALANVATRGDRDRLAAVVATGGGVAPLVELLSSQRMRGQAGAAGALSLVAYMSPERSRAILEAGAVAPLVQLLGSADEMVQANAVDAIYEVCHIGGAANAARAAFVAAGALPPVVRLLRGANRHALHHTIALASDRTVRGSAERRQAIVALGGMPALLRHLRSADPQIAEATAAAVANLTAKACPTIRQAVVTAGAVEPLLALLESSDSEAVATAARALNHLTSRGVADLAAGEVATRVAPALVRCLRRSVVNSRADAFASTALMQLASSANHAQAVVDAGGVPVLAQTISRHGAGPLAQGSCIRRCHVPDAARPRGRCRGGRPRQHHLRCAAGDAAPPE